MKKFFDSRRELVGSGPGCGPMAGGTSSGGGGSFIGRVFTIGRYQVTVEETIAEGELCTHTHKNTQRDDLRCVVQHNQQYTPGPIVEALCLSVRAQVTSVYRSLR